MSEEVLKKKKKKEVFEQSPSFDHESKDIIKAIGIDLLVESITEKMKLLSTEDKINSPSKMVEYLYDNFNKIELSFMVMHSFGQERNELKENETISE